MPQTVAADSLRSLVDEHPDPRTALLPALWSLIEAGRLSPEDIREAAELCQVDTQAVHALLNRHSADPQAGSEPAVCTDLVCSLMGAEELRLRLRAETGSLPRRSSCLGCCHAAPVFRSADGQLHSIRSEGFTSDD